MSSARFFACSSALFSQWNVPTFQASLRLLAEKYRVPRGIGQGELTCSFLRCSFVGRGSLYTHLH